MQTYEIRKQIEKNIKHDKYSMLVHTWWRFTLIWKQYDTVTNRVNCSYTHWFNDILSENITNWLYLTDDSKSSTLEYVECVLSSYDLIDWNFPSKDKLIIKEWWNPELWYVLKINNN